MGGGIILGLGKPDVIINHLYNLPTTSYSIVTVENTYFERGNEVIREIIGIPTRNGIAEIVI